MHRHLLCLPNNDVVPKRSGYRSYQLAIRRDNIEHAPRQARLLRYGLSDIDTNGTQLGIKYCVFSTILEVPLLQRLVLDL
jgi:hypothetical protein